jgi:hypothetical protein
VSNEVNSYTSTPQQAHMYATKRILRYTKGTIDSRLMFPRKDARQKVGYVDANWSRDLDRRRSTTSLPFNVGCNSIVWSSNLLWHYP